jgi:ABC-2 type transport system permease protein
MSTPPAPTAGPSASGALSLAPAPGAASRAARWSAQARLEWRLLMTNGEQVLLTLVIPVAVLVAVTQLGLAGIDEAAPGVMALAILSSAFTATAIATGFERRSGVLKFLGATPLGRSGLLVGKVVATLAVIVLQLVVIAGAALLLGWSPATPQPIALVALIVLGTVALGSWGFALAGLLRAEATLAVANGIFLLLLFAGGTVLPTDRLPDPLGAVASLLPSAALGDALRALLDPALAGSTGTPWSDLLVLAAWAVAGTLVAVRTFRWE